MLIGHRFVVMIITSFCLYANHLISIATACGSQLQSQYAKGDYLFGGIDFHGKGGYTYGSILDRCSWSGHGEASSKFMLEFQHIDTGM